MTIDWLATSNLIETAHRALADAARKAGNVDHEAIHDAIAYLTEVSETARRKWDGVKTNVGDPNPKGPSGGKKQR